MNGMVEYYTIEIRSKIKEQWSYSAADLQNALNEAFSKKKLERLFVSLYGYLESRKRNNYLDFSYMGGTLLLVFEDLTLELIIHAGGVIEYRIIPDSEINIPKSARKGFPPRDMSYLGDNYFFDLENEMDDLCLARTVDKITVKSIECYPFVLNGFDEARADAAEERGDLLPAEVDLIFDNGTVLRLIGDEIENFLVKLDE